MRAVTAGAVLMLIVSGCTEGRQNASAPEDEPQTPMAIPEQRPSGDPDALAKLRADGMNADVSPLTANVSGLSTRVTDMGLVIDLPSDVLFDYGKSDLSPAAEVELRKAADMIRASPPGAIQVIGHTDSHGSDDDNQILSEARARAVTDWFGQQVGVRQRQFSAVGKGEKAPVAPNVAADGDDDPAGRAKNRRVEVIVPVTRAN